MNIKIVLEMTKKRVKALYTLSQTLESSISALIPAETAKHAKLQHEADLLLAQLVDRIEIYNAIKKCNQELRRYIVEHGGTLIFEQERTATTATTTTTTSSPQDLTT